MLLTIDTCFNACSVALCPLDGIAGGRILAERYDEIGRGHAEALLPMVRDVMRDAATPIEHVRMIGVTVGPGTFTGVRIGVAAARALALAAGAQCIGADSLSTMLWAIRQRVRDGADATGRIVIAMDARRGQVYFLGPGDEASDGTKLLDTTVAARRLRGGDLVVGSAAQALVDEAAILDTAATAYTSELQPSASDLALAIACDEHHPLDVTPLYLRPPDAKPQRGKSLEVVDR